ncbi:hypothetical protein [Thermogemmatispora tikiterensis]|uniref:Uncharacterized protein n=1 Tax=Thermogemmatispora tikiterensis TaxID=1825093 RepID=A0A328VG39_9CHLR|nr:hypothetical protein [Thermogemmatispora tikiterensis]RAQ96686.1 hypothetical protein A4R35_14170 [Thermogemmatispora tikiterensis]
MPFTRLLLIGATSSKCINGEKGDKVIIAPKNHKVKAHLGHLDDPYAGEVILCFQLDDGSEQARELLRSLGIRDGDRRCDGLIFYSRDGSPERTVCLVELKHSRVEEAAAQLIRTRQCIEDLLCKECGEPGKKYIQRLQWKACLYRHGASPDETSKVLKELRRYFKHYCSCDHQSADIGPFLRGESEQRIAEGRRGRKRER